MQLWARCSLLDTTAAHFPVPLCILPGVSPHRALSCCCSELSSFLRPGLTQPSSLGRFLAPSALPYVPLLLASGCKELLFPATPSCHRCSSLHVLFSPSWVLQQECEDGCSEYSHKGERTPWVEWERAVSASPLLGLPWGLQVTVMAPEPCLPSLPSCTPFHSAFPGFRFSI